MTGLGGSKSACCALLSKHGHDYFEVADVPGWQEYEPAELKSASRSKFRVATSSLLQSWVVG
jgi:hypothetical protein